MSMEKNCLSYLGATIWNSIDSSIRNVKTCNTFKHKIKCNILKISKLERTASIITNL